MPRRQILTAIIPAVRTVSLPAIVKPGIADRSAYWLRSPIILLALAVAALALLVPPGGEFPIDIDWNYSWVVQSLLDGRQVVVSPWTAATLVLQVYWGGIFAKLFGFSQTTLRVSTLV